MQRLVCLIRWNYRFRCTETLLGLVPAARNQRYFEEKDSSSVALTCAVRFHASAEGFTLIQQPTESGLFEAVRS